MQQDYDRDRSRHAQPEPGHHSSGRGYGYGRGRGRRGGRELWGRGGADFGPGDFDQGGSESGREYGRPTFGSLETYGPGYGREYGPQWEYGRRRAGRGHAGPGHDFEAAEHGGQEPGRPAWAVPGPHVGRGPRGYRRSDERIYEDVCERLTQHGQIDASEIEVQVQHGEVTLSGLVESRSEKRAAEDAIEDVAGVLDVHNQLRVRQQRLGIEGWPRGETGLPLEQAEQRGWAARSTASEAALTGHGGDQDGGAGSDRAPTQ